MKVFICVISWILTAIFSIFGLVLLPSISSIFLFAVAIVTLPLEKWQKLLNRFLKKPVKVILIVILFVVAVMVSPTTTDDEDTIDSDKEAQTEETGTITQNNDTIEIESAINESEGTQPYETGDTTREIDDSEAVVQEPDVPESSEQESNEPEHVHSFSVVSCINDSVCSCGEIKESAKGHIWISATCNEAKKCSACGINEGSAKGHSWSEATCVSAKKCSTCGVSEGSAKGHSWSAATCVSAKKCTVCNTTEGSAKGHSYSNGICGFCGINDPNYVSESMVWIPTNGGTKYHSHSDCSNMDNPSHVTESYAISQGFGPCGRCY